MAINGLGWGEDLCLYEKTGKKTADKDECGNATHWLSLFCESEGK